MKGDLPEIRAGLQARIGDLCRTLLPAGRAEGGLWVAHNPTVAGDDRKLPALKVRISGGDLGAWTDYRNGRDGYAGDAIGLIAYLHRTDTKGALAWARDFLGLRAMGRQEREAMRFAAEARRKQEEKRAEKRRLHALREADQLFHTPAGAGVYGRARTEGTAALGAGSPAEAHARAYFAARGCPLDEVTTLNPRSFRFSAGTEWWKGALWRHEGERRWKEREGPMLPAVHAAMRQATGIVTACHFTFLDPARPAKAPVEPPKMMAGEKKGAVIELAMGPDGTWFWTDETPGLVVLCEGIETGLSLAPEVEREGRLWACGDLSNMGEAPVWLPCAGRIVVARDNNTGNAQAQKQFDRAMENIEAAGKPFAIINSHVGDDFNDLAKGEE